MRSHHPGHLADRAAVAERVEQHGDASPSPEHAAIAPSACSSNSSAMNDALWPPTNTKSPWQPLNLRGEIDHLGHVGEIVQREADRVGAKTFDLRIQVAMLENLQIDHPDVVAGRAPAAATRSIPSGSRRR